MYVFSCIKIKIGNLFYFSNYYFQIKIEKVDIVGFLYEFKIVKKWKKKKIGILNLEN